MKVVDKDFIFSAIKNEQLTNETKISLLEKLLLGMVVCKGAFVKMHDSIKQEERSLKKKFERQLNIKTNSKWEVVTSLLTVDKPKDDNGVTLIVATLERINNLDVVIKEYEETLWSIYYQTDPDSNTDTANYVVSNMAQEALADLKKAKE